MGWVSLAGKLPPPPPPTPSPKPQTPFCYVTLIVRWYSCPWVNDHNKMNTTRATTLACAAHVTRKEWGSDKAGDRRLPLSRQHQLRRLGNPNYANQSPCANNWSNERIRLTCLHPCCHLTKIKRWFVWEDTNVMFARVRTCTIATSQTNHRVVWIGWQQGCNYVSRFCSTHLPSFLPRRMSEFSPFSSVLLGKSLLSRLISLRYLCMMLRRSVDVLFSVLGASSLICSSDSDSNRWRVWDSTADSTCSGILWGIDKVRTW